MLAHEIPAQIQYCRLIITCNVAESIEERRGPLLQKCVVSDSHFHLNMSNLHISVSPISARHSATKVGHEIGHQNKGVVA